MLNNQVRQQKDFIIGNKRFNSRLMIGTGKYKNIEEAKKSINASECEIVTVAIRRAQNHKLKGNSNIIDALNWNNLWLLPNTAGCETAEEAIRIAKIGREIVKYLGQEDNNFVKLEVIPDSKYLLPDPIGTLKAAEYLLKKGFTVLPYINADVVLAKQLEELGCSTVMPLGSPIGSGQGLQNLFNINMIIDSVNLPVIVDAGIGTPSEACQAMEIGADGVLMNSAIAKAQNSKEMARAMKEGTEAGRKAFLAGRMPNNKSSKASSTLLNISK
uniref:thiamin biosynthesis protein G n=1 Tax=Pseudoerythrocladia kornmannii TaxID=753682 RepID=UPI001BEFE61D|nr:thiamin biosynthesis protein G [Pseudoerythrocladia kornmannii]QUE28342.1 ThiG [Pseudoerythrocladia kornmannii]UNJ16847.1 thiamin biosynthesis protein G [Pseudoerythrocladia kornmannii]